MKKQRNEKPIDEELLMRMMAGEAAGMGEPGTGKGETAVPVEKAQEGGGGDKTAQGKAGGLRDDLPQGHGHPRPLRQAGLCEA